MQLGKSFMKSVKSNEERERVIVPIPAVLQIFNFKQPTVQVLDCYGKRAAVREATNEGN